VSPAKAKQIPQNQVSNKTSLCCYCCFNTNSQEDYLMEESLPLTCWQHFSWCSPGYHYPTSHQGPRIYICSVYL